jgi:hypothetical protein
MFSYSIIFFSLTILLYKKDTNNGSNLYGILFTSFCFSHLLLGLFCLILTLLGKTNFPILFVSIIFLIVSLKKIKFKYKVFFGEFKESLTKEINYIKEDLKLTINKEIF